ncbi:MAG: DUF1080 domain-containing protein [Pirellulaceae bacterium]
MNSRISRYWICLIAAVCLLSASALDVYAAPRAGLLRRIFSRRAACCCAPSAPASAAANAAAANTQPAWKPLFDGKSLDGWKVTPYGGEGEVAVEDGQIMLNMGASLTGITYTGEVPKTNYEIRLEAMRDQGIDFFCGLTFPVADSHCSFIVGGWAGSVVGLSSINGLDASENDTTRFMKFEEDRWYKFKVRVTPERIQCWIDGELEVDQDIEGKRIGLRNEVDLNKPLGLSSFETKARLRNIEIRLLGAGESGEGESGEGEDD